MSADADRWRPLSPPELRGAWNAALASGDPERALMLRRGERLHSALPAVVGGVRRVALVEADAFSSTWEGVAVESGARARLRVLDPDQAADPELRQTFAAPAASRAERPADPLPCLRCALPGPSLGQLIEDNDLHAEATVYRWAATGLAALAALHAEGQRVGDRLGAALCLGPEGLRCVLLGPAAPAAADPRADVQAFAAALSALASEPPGPLSALLASWVDDPPPSAHDAGALLGQTMARSLLERRHRLALRHRNRQSRARHAALRALVEALAAALPPPRADVAVHCGHDGLLTRVESDVQHVKVGTAERGGPVAWAPLWSAAAGLDAPRARALLRAWATRGRGDEAGRAAANAALGAQDLDAERLMRWIAAVARLRAARLLLAHR